MSSRLTITKDYSNVNLDEIVEIAKDFPLILCHGEMLGKETL